MIYADKLSWLATYDSERIINDSDHIRYICLLKRWVRIIMNCNDYCYLLFIW